MLRHRLIALAFIFIAQATLAEPITINLLVPNGNGADVIKLPLEAAELSETIKNMLDDSYSITKTMRTDGKEYSFELPMSYDISNRTWDAIAKALKAMRTLKKFQKEFTFSKIKTIVKDFCFPAEKPAKPEDVLNFVLAANFLHIPDLLLPAAALYVDMARRNHLKKPFAKVPKDLMGLFKDYETWLDDPQLLVKRVPIEFKHNKDNRDYKRYPSAMAIANNKLYLSLFYGISIIDLKTNQLLETHIKVRGQEGQEGQEGLGGQDFSTLAVAGNKLYAGGFTFGALSTLIAIDVNTDKIIGDPVLVGAVNTMVVSGDYLYVLKLVDNNIVVVEVATNKVIGDPIQLGGTPRLLAVGGNKLFVNDLGSSTVFVIDLTTRKVTKKPIPSRGYIHAFQVVANKLYVQAGESDFYTIDVATNKLENTGLGVIASNNHSAIVGTTLCVPTLNGIVLIDTTTNKIMGKPLSNPKGNGSDLVASGDKLYAYVQAEGILEMFDFEKFLYYQR